MSDPNEKLVTRDPEVMEHTPKDADYAGAETVEGLDSGLIEVRVGNGAGLSTVPLDPAAHNNPNPSYTPPSQQVTPHPREGAADMPEGDPAEIDLERNGQGR